tara:strand:- start:383 stop:565 length:183 start_codon:yes stop_codon:yes gene_type:complete
MMYHESLENFIETNFSLIQHHNWRLGDIENMIPWEKQTYVKMLSNYIEKINLENQQRQNG